MSDENQADSALTVSPEVLCEHESVIHALKIENANLKLRVLEVQSENLRIQHALVSDELSKLLASQQQSNQQQTQ